MSNLLFVCNKPKGRISKRVFQENKTRQNFRKTNTSYPLIRTRTCAYQGVRNVCFSKNLASFVFLKHPFWDSSFGLLPTSESICGYNTGKTTWNKFALLNRTGYLQDYSTLTITNTIKITFYEKLITETRFIVLKKIEIWRRLCYFFRTHLEHGRVICFASVKIIGFREDYKNDNAKSNTFFKGTKILTLIIHNPGRYASKPSKAFHTSCFSIKLSFFNFFYFATNILSNIISSFIHLL